MGQDNIIRAALFTPGLNHRWGLPLILRGEPGTAKTARAAQIAQAAGLQFVSFIASIREPSDIMGLPVITDQDVSFKPGKWATGFNDGRGVILFDEINTAPPAVQAALLRVILEGVAGDIKLPNGVRFIAAMNSTDDAAGGWDLAMPLANRFGHMEWNGGSEKEWADYMMSAGNGNEVQATTDPKAEEARVTKEWAGKYAEAAGLVTAYILRNPSELHRKPQAGSPQASGSWSSRRTWEMAIRARAGARIHGLSEAEEDEFLSSFIGSSAARQFRAWARSMDLPDPEKLLDGKIQFDPDPDRLDRTLAVFNSCTALVSPTSAEKRVERAEALWKMMARCLDNKDIIVPAARKLCDKKVALARGAAADKVLIAVNPVLKASGIIGGGAQ